MRARRLFLSTSLLISSVASNTFLNAQTPVDLAPGTEVLLYKVDSNQENLTLNLIGNISQAEGYDNQPSFSPDSKSVLFVSARDGKQMDIYQYQISSKKLLQLTDTPENEFSPMLERSGKSFTAVREGGEPYQSVHRYAYLPKSKAAKESSWAVKSQTPIGYYAFNEKGIAVGWARWANSIYIFNPDSQYATFAIGHALPSKPLLIPGSANFSFVHRQADDQAWIKSINPITRAITPIAPLLDGNIDYNWLLDGRIVSGKGSELHVWSSKEQKWSKLADLTKDKVFNISRLAASNDGKYLAIVANVPK